MRLDFSDNYQGCFVCGKENKYGLKMEFSYDEVEKEMYATYRFPQYMQGYENIVHGGFVSMVLDEVMAKVCIYEEIPAVTARMEVRFRKPVYVNEVITVRGRIVSRKGETIQLLARCLDKSGIEKVRAEAVFIRIY